MEYIDSSRCKNKISIIVPIYNLQNYIERCVKSILEQTYDNIEVILVDDGSSDDSWKIIKKLAQQDNRIVLLKKENGGVTSARLAGIEKATGKWIGFVDGDDEIENDMYELLLSNALKHGADISHCGYQMIFPDGRVNYFYNTDRFFKHDKITALKELLDGKFIEPGLCNKLFNKDLFVDIIRNDRMPKNIKINEDLLMNYYLFANTKLSVYEDVCKYHYIVRNNSASRSKKDIDKIFDPIKVKQIILKHSESDILETAQRAYVSTCINVYNGLILEKGNKYRKEKKSIKKMIYINRNWFSYLSKKQYLLAILICYMSFVYPVLYRFYAKFLLKNKYD